LHGTRSIGILPRDLGKPEAIMAKSRFEQALGDVSKIFKSPQAVAEASDLTNREKIELLKQWETDLRLLMVASEEDMPSNSPGRTAELLSAVLKSLTRMGVSGDETHQAPNKSGGA
jgi:hypothetical protein